MTDKIKPSFGYGVLMQDGTVIYDSRIKSEQDALAYVSAGQECRVFKAKVSEHKKRSLDQNALYHVFIQTLSNELGNDIEHMESIIKIDFGIPIIMTDSELGPQLDWILKRYEWDALPYASKLRLIKWIPITRLMSAKQMKEMITNLQNWAQSKFNIELRSIYD